MRTRSFTRSQIAALVATLLDYGVIFLLAGLFHFWYVLATAAGASVGAVTNFLLNRHWSFQAAGAHWQGQALRYALVSAGSLLLNSAGVYFVTEHFGLHYKYSVVLVSAGVGVLFNYPLHRFFVYRHKGPQSA